VVKEKGDANRMSDRCNSCIREKASYAGKRFCDECKDKHPEKPFSFYRREKYGDVN